MMERYHPGSTDPRNQIDAMENDLEERGPVDKRVYQAALKMAMTEADNHNRRLDGLPPRQQGGQPMSKQAKTEQIHFVDVPEDEILQAVVEGRLSTEEKKEFLEAKRKSVFGSMVRE